MGDQAQAQVLDATPLGLLLALPQTEALLGVDLAEVEWLLGKVEKVGRCWIWRASLDTHGYGHGRFRGRLRLAHRISYELFVGEIPDGLVLDHLCRQPSCVNPEHLEAVTNRENVLRGNSIVAKHALKTQCPQGHKYDKVVARGEGTARICTVCQREHSKRQAAQQKAARHAARAAR